MVEFKIHDDTLEVTVLGWSKLWALRSRIRVPLTAVRSIRHDPAAARAFAGWRLPGTHFPGVITAGTYRWKGKKSFWDVRKGERTVVVELEGASYDRLVVEVPDPDATVRQVQAVI